MTSQRPPRPTIADVFDEGAISYAEYWAPALHRHAFDLVGTVGPPAARQGRTVLDVAAGAGTLLPALIPLAGDAAAGGLVVALDSSAGMLALADPTVPRLQADAGAMPLRDGCADIAVYAFVLFMLPDARVAVAEAARVLGSDGWLLAATWGEQLDTAADVVVREEMDAVDAPPFPKFPRSDDLTDSPDRMQQLLETAGFTDVVTTTRPLDARFDAESALAMRTGTGGLGWRFARLTPGAQDQVRRRAAARLAALAPDEFLDRSVVQLTTARIPPSRSHRQGSRC